MCAFSIWPPAKPTRSWNISFTHHFCALSIVILYKLLEKLAIWKTDINWFKLWHRKRNFNDLIGTNSLLPLFQQPLLPTRRVEKILSLSKQQAKVFWKNTRPNSKVFVGWLKRDDVETNVFNSNFYTYWLHRRATQIQKCSKAAYAHIWAL